MLAVGIGQNSCINSNVLKSELLDKTIDPSMPTQHYSTSISRSILLVPIHPFTQVFQPKFANAMLE